MLSHILEATIIVLVCEFILSMAFINYLVNGPVLSEPYPKQVMMTPAAIGFLNLGLMGLVMVMLIPKNFKRGLSTLAKRQFYVGFSLIFICYIGLELMLGLTY